MYSISIYETGINPHAEPILKARTACNNNVGVTAQKRYTSTRPGEVVYEHVCYRSVSRITLSLSFRSNRDLSIEEKGVWYIPSIGALPFMPGCGTTRTYSSIYPIPLLGRTAGCPRR